jgi:putative AbiEii toxin of type IV toxin-antitoxin system/AAA domain-containing protein
MYISHIRLENIRGFSGRRNVDLTLTRPDGSYAGWTVLAGRNGSGKSSLLRAIALTVSGPFVAPNLVPDFRTWTTVGQRRGTTDLDLTTGPEDFQPTDGSKRARNLIVGLSWDVDPGLETSRSGSQPVMHHNAAFDVRVTLESNPFVLTPWQSGPIGWFCAAYGPFRRLAGGSAETQRLMSTPGPVARVASLFYEDASLTEGVRWLVDKHLRSLEGAEWAGELVRATIRVLADGLLPNDYEVSEVDSDGVWVVSCGHRFPLREMSDGYRSLAALVVDLIRQVHDCFGDLYFEVRDSLPVITAPGIVIIDEVDAHLHVSWQRRIGTWLKTHFPNIQFIVTTHSPYICQAADPGGLIRLPGPDEDKPPHVVGQDLYDRVVFGGGDDTVLSELFGLETPH